MLHSRLCCYTPGPSCLFQTGLRILLHMAPSGMGFHWVEKIRKSGFWKRSSRDHFAQHDLLCHWAEDHTPSPSDRNRSKNLVTSFWWVMKLERILKETQHGVVASPSVVAHVEIAVVRRQADDGLTIDVQFAGCKVAKWGHKVGSLKKMIRHGLCPGPSDLMVLARIPTQEGACWDYSFLTISQPTTSWPWLWALKPPAC